jgi:hypothetical protein
LPADVVLEVLKALVAQHKQISELLGRDLFFDFDRAMCALLLSLFLCVLSFSGALSIVAIHSI